MPTGSSRSIISGLDNKKMLRLGQHAASPFRSIETARNIQQQLPVAMKGPSSGRLEDRIGGGIRCLGGVAILSFRLQ